MAKQYCDKRGNHVELMLPQHLHTIFTIVSLG